VLNRFHRWLSLGGTALMGVAAAFAGVMAQRAGESVWVTVWLFATAAGCAGYLIFAKQTWSPPAPVVSRDEQLAEEARTYDLEAVAALAAVLTDDDPEVSIEIDDKPTDLLVAKDQTVVAQYSHWSALWNSLAAHDYLSDWNWDDPPAEIFAWFCQVVARRWPGVDLRALAASHGHLETWTSDDYNPNRDDTSIDSPATLDGYLAPFGIRVGWFENGQVATMFAVSQRGFDRIAALQHDFGLRRPVAIRGIEQASFRRT